MVPSCVFKGDLHVVQDTPATVGVSGAKTFAAGGVLSAVLHWNPGQLQEDRQQLSGEEHASVVKML